MNFKYNSNFDEIVSLHQLKHQVCINALCFTNSIKEAAEEVGITERSMHDFLKEVNLDYYKIQKMRKEFKNEKIKIKRRTKN